MSSFQRKHMCSYFLVLFILFEVGFANSSEWSKTFGNKKFSYSTITVDRSGHGNFSTIQAAIDSIPSNNKNWVCIRIKAGIYREKIKIPSDKPHIILKGRGKRKTHVVWGDHQSTSQSPTFASFADHIVVKSMSFTNSYNSPVNSKPRKPAVAAMISGENSMFFRCGFFGLQDTLWDDQGKHYYYLCTIQGAVDFIFGGGQSLFERCSISVLGGALEAGVSGFITAQGRTNPNDSSGFVFKNCHVHGTGSTFLGRPWRAFSRVLFYNTNFSVTVVPQGWHPWWYAGEEHRLTFAESGCFGEEYDTSHRVKWEKKLTPQTIKQLTSLSFIDDQGWLQNQPF